MSDVSISPNCVAHFLVHSKVGTFFKFFLKHLSCGLMRQSPAMALGSTISWAPCTCPSYRDGGTRWELDGQPQLSWEKLQSNKRKELERLSDLYMDNLKKADVEFIEGRARIVDPNTVEVNGKQYRVRVLHVH